MNLSINLLEKMKRTILLTTLLWLAVTVGAQSYTFNHGPYLQELTEEGVTVVFTTSQKGFSWVELQTQQGEVSRHYALRDGLRDAYNTFCTVRIKGLNPYTSYSYRMVSKEITDFQPYNISFGDSIVSPWYSFTTINPQSDSCSFIALSDMHQHPEKLDKLLRLAQVESADWVFYVGDMMNYYDNEEVPFKSFIDKSVELFATEKPFVLVRGNHETRGNMAREYARYVPKSDGHFYGAYRVGEIMFVFLDCGEDKPDDTRVYGGLNDFDAYRSEQAEWFAQLIQSKTYKRAKWHIVFNHFPPMGETPDNPEDHGLYDVEKKFLPLFNKAKIDMMFSGHMHRYAYWSPNEKKELTFPVIIGSTETVSRVDIKGDRMEIEVKDTKGDTVKKLTVEK